MTDLGLTDMETDCVVTGCYFTVRFSYTFGKVKVNFAFALTTSQLFYR